MSRVIKVGGVRHGLHAIISLFTCGLWLPVWFIVWVLSPKPTTIREDTNHGQWQGAPPGQWQGPPSGQWQGPPQ